MSHQQQSRGDEEDSSRVRELEEEIRVLEAEYARARKKASVYHKIDLLPLTQVY
jgi:hypothetical protein